MYPTHNILGYTYNENTAYVYQSVIAHKVFFDASFPSMFNSSQINLPSSTQRTVSPHLSTKTSFLSHFIQFRDCLSWLSIIKFPPHQISYHPRSDTHQAEENTPHNIRSKRIRAKINSNIIVCDTRPEENKRYHLPKPFATVLGTRTII